VAAVIAHHFSSQVLPSGYLGVDIFFVISGYVISASLAGETHHQTRDFLFRFYARRIKRILPALVICIFVTAVVGSAFIDPKTTEYSYIIKSGASALLGVSNLYFFREAADYFAPSVQLNLFTQTWSLGVEEQFYLLFPTLFLLLAKSGQKKTHPHTLLHMFLLRFRSAHISGCQTPHHTPPIS